MVKDLYPFLSICYQYQLPDYQVRPPPSSHSLSLIDVFRILLTTAFNPLAPHSAIMSNDGLPRNRPNPKPSNTEIQLAAA
jgi:hypothetical protein